MMAWSVHARIALYYAPAAASAWWQAGSTWLGRDAESGAVCVQPQPDGLTRPLAALTESPRRYGWHGTLVPPFRPADGVDFAAVAEVAAAWAVTQAPFLLGVNAGKLGHFIAARPDSPEDEAAMCSLAASALRALHPLRATPTQAELERRLAAPLTERQRALLIEWGYPYVFDEFRFHMTLSNSLAEVAEREALLRWWQPRVRELGPLQVNEAALFVEPGPGEPFTLWRRLRFGAGAAPRSTTVES